MTGASPNHPPPSIERRRAPGLVVAALLFAAACGDDGVTAPQDTETGTSTGTDTTVVTSTSTSGVDTTESASGSASGSSGSSSSGLDSTGSSSTGETDSTTGEPAVSGHAVHQLVNAGTRTASRSYTLVHTLGQPSPLQSTHESTSYRLQAGLVGANGSPP